jgi:cell volume regulation protein A
LFPIDRLLLIGSLLLLVGLASSKLSSKAGLPVLLLYIGVGMLAGSEGVGGIEFADYTIAHGAGTLALALILFDGGLRTRYQTIRPVLAPSLVLATVGVVLTAAVTGVAAHYVLGVSLLEGILLGSIIGSTDAAAVFAVLRSSGLNTAERVRSTLEVESGSNDPMAVFLTVGLLEVLLGRLPLGAGLLVLFVKQMSIGAVVGFAVGRLTGILLNRVELGAAGLYPVLTSAAGLLAYSLAATLGGSGFLSVYLAGIVLGSGTFVFQRGILLFHDGAAWLAQIGMFVLLGLLSFPSRLVSVALPALAIAAVLIVIARPAAIGLLLAPFRFNIREVAFISLAGLKGAVPIILGTYPLLLGLPGSERLFDVVFFVVLASTIAQGWTLAPAAKLLGLQEASAPAPPLSLEITSLKHVHGDIVEYTVEPDSPIAGHTIRELALPDDAVVAMVVRDDRIIPPRGSTRIQVGDYVFFIVKPEMRALVERFFVHGRAAFVDSLGEGLELPVQSSMTLMDLEELYGIAVEDGAKQRTLDEVLRDRLGDRLEVGRGVTLGGLKVRVREVSEGRIVSVGLVITSPDTEDPRDGGPPVSL